MSILGNINNIIDEDDSNNGYTTPAVIRDENNYISFKKALVMSMILHPAVVVPIWIVATALALLGINLFMFDKPKPKMNDIEFVLVDREATPINKNTRYRADKNSRGGGVNDPKRKVSMPSPKPAKTQKPKPASSAGKKAPTKTSAVAQKTVKKPSAKPAHTSPSPAKKNVSPKPAPPSVKPSVAPKAAPKVTTTPKTAFIVSVPSNTSAGKLS